MKTIEYDSFNKLKTYRSIFVISGFRFGFWYFAVLIYFIFISDGNC